MYDKAPYFYGTGRRKSSVARVRIYQGTGKVTINDRDIDDYFGLDTLKTIVRQPLVLTETDEKFDIVCRVAGGGVTGQAGAIRHRESAAPVRFRKPPREAEEGWLPHPRPENEGKKEIRSQSSPSRSAVLEEIISPIYIFLETQNPRKPLVFGGFLCPKLGFYLSG